MATNLWQIVIVKLNLKKMTDEQYKMAVAAERGFEHLKHFEREIKDAFWNLRNRVGKESAVFNELESDVEKAILKAEKSIKDVVKKCC